MHTINAIYDNGKFLLLEKPIVTKSKVKITFYDHLEKDFEDELPVYSLGKIDDKVSEMYDEYLSARF
jgi:hypothetical protein